jgi:hypothetical protein
VALRIGRPLEPPRTAFSARPTSSRSWASTTCRRANSGTPARNDRRGRSSAARRPSPRTSTDAGSRRPKPSPHGATLGRPTPRSSSVAATRGFIDGVNTLIWHTFTCSPQAFGKPGIEYFAGTHINPNVTWFEQAAPFITYLGRCQHLLQRGLFVADVAAYVGDLPYQHWGRYTTNWNANATLALPTGYGYDILNNEVLLTRASVKNGRITLPDGMSYGLLAVDFDDERATPAGCARSPSCGRQARRSFSVRADPRAWPARAAAMTRSSAWPPRCGERPPHPPQT